MKKFLWRLLKTFFWIIICMLLISSVGLGSVLLVKAFPIFTGIVTLVIFTVVIYNLVKEQEEWRKTKE